MLLTASDMSAKCPLFHSDLGAKAEGAAWEELKQRDYLINLRLTKEQSPRITVDFVIKT